MTQKNNLEKIIQEANEILNKQQSLKAFEKFISKYPSDIVDQVLERVY